MIFSAALSTALLPRPSLPSPLRPTCTALWELQWIHRLLAGLAPFLLLLTLVGLLPAAPAAAQRSALSPSVPGPTVMGHAVPGNLPTWVPATCPDLPIRCVDEVTSERTHTQTLGLAYPQVAQRPDSVEPTSPEDQQAIRSLPRSRAANPFSPSPTALDPAPHRVDGEQALELARRLVHRSGAGRHLDQSAALLTVRLSEKKLELPPGFLQNFTLTLTGAFEGDDLREQLAQRLVRNLDPATLAAVDAFYDSSLGRRVAFLEHRVDTPEGLQGLAAYVDVILETPPSPQRVALLHALDRASLAVDTRLDTSVQLLHAILGGLQPFLTADQRLSDTDLTVELIAYRHDIQSTLRSQTYILNLYAYHDLSDAQLSEYLDFWHSRAGQNFAQSLAHGVPATLERAGDVGGERLALQATGLQGDQIAHNSLTYQ